MELIFCVHVVLIEIFPPPTAPMTVMGPSGPHRRVRTVLYADSSHQNKTPLDFRNLH